MERKDNHKFDIRKIKRSRIKMKQELGRFRNWLMRQKVYASRSMSYISLLNTAILVYLAIITFNKSHDITVSGWYAIPIIIILTIGTLLVGWLEVKMGFFGAEQKVTADTNPRIVEIIDKLDNIQKDVDELKKK